MKPARLVLLPLLLMLACQPASKPENRTDGGTATADTVALLAKRPGPDAPRSAADRLVRALYFEHSKTENPLRETSSRVLIDQFFAPPTADLLWSRKKQSSVKTKAAALNPLFNAPDKVIHKTWVEPAAVVGSKAVVYVTFEKAGKPQEIRVEMQQLAGRWRITKLLFPDGSRLP